MSVVNDTLYDVSLFVSSTASASFEAFLYAHSIRPYSKITESSYGFTYHFEKMALQDCSYISFMFDVIIEKMQGVINFD